jgi:hypothetical protein
MNIHIITNSENKTIIECSVTTEDMFVAVNIRNFVDYLNELHKWSQSYFVDDIDQLSNIRDWCWEQRNSGEYNSTDEFVADKYNKLIGKYNAGLDEDDPKLLIYIIQSFE